MEVWRWSDPQQSHSVRQSSASLGRSENLTGRYSHWFQAQRKVKCLYAKVMGRCRAAPACYTTPLTTRSWVVCPPVQCPNVNSNMRVKIAAQDEVEAGRIIPARHQAIRGPL